MTEEKQFYLTAKKLKELKKEYDVLKALRVAKTKGEVPSTWESEDLNPEYLSFQEDLNFLETRIEELSNILKNVAIIKSPVKNKRDTVGLGAKVSVEIDGQDKDQFMIVGTLEANPSLGIISNESPVGKALLGFRKGDEVSVSSPIETVYKIKKIEYS